jgi:hypothetical protein
MNDSQFVYFLFELAYLSVLEEEIEGNGKQFL